MENEKSTGNKYTVKDAAIIGIFCAVMFVVFMVYSTLTGASLFYSMIFNAAGAALILAPFYVYMCMKVGKHGPALVYNIMWAIMVLRILMMVMAAQPVIGMPPGEVVAVFKKIHAPDGIALPVTFMLRFFPTVRSEFSDVFASLRLRKLLSWKHPLDAMEYIVTPVIFRSSRIAEELAASAESRGISNPGKHTCRRKIEFQKRDWIMCAIAVCVTALYFVLERTVA